MIEFFKNVDIPKQRILFLHVKLRQLQALTQKSYYQLSHDLIATLQTLYQPTAILVPSYTIYTFMFGGVFHPQFSKSEVGRFSEEVRRHFAQFRTPEPMFSVVDVNGYLKKAPSSVHHQTFGQAGLLNYLTEQDYVIVNIGLEVLYATQVHFVEHLVGVDYRFEKMIEGFVCHNENEWQKVNYQAYVRQVDQHKVSYPAYDQRKREAYLLNQSELKIATNHSVRIAWISSQAFTKAIHAALLQDRHFLI